MPDTTQAETEPLLKDGFDPHLHSEISMRIAQALALAFQLLEVTDPDKLYPLLVELAERAVTAYTHLSDVQTATSADSSTLIDPSLLIARILAQLPDGLLQRAAELADNEVSRRSPHQREVGAAVDLLPATLGEPPRPTTRAQANDQVFAAPADPLGSESGPGTQPAAAM